MSMPAAPAVAYPPDDDRRVHLCTALMPPPAEQLRHLHLQELSHPHLQRLPRRPGLRAPLSATQGREQLDVDLLARRADRRRALGVLSGLGYRSWRRDFHART